MPLNFSCQAQQAPLRVAAPAVRMFVGASLLASPQRVLLPGLVSCFPALLAAENLLSPARFLVASAHLLLPPWFPLAAENLLPPPCFPFLAAGAAACALLPARLGWLAWMVPP